MHARREFLKFLAGIAMLPALTRFGFAQSPEMSRPTAYSFSFKTLDGGLLRLSQFAGRPILVVNVASQCGFTPQYAGLKDLQTRFGERLVIVGVPSNEFNQEPGGPQEIIATAQGHYGVAFPLTKKLRLRGPEAHPFYRWAAAERPLDVPTWNFHKYLIGRDGHIATAFSTQVEPSDARVIEAITKELKAG
jgi:glutathione peroxidase